MKPTEITVLSGKGGTGKTTVSTNLALALSRRMAVQYLDCDVEAPNGHLFLKPDIAGTIPVSRLVPKINPIRCQHGGECSDFCAYQALAALPDKTIVYPEMCHSCGGCARLCPTGAIREVEHRIGTVTVGKADAVDFVQGEMLVRETATVPMIRAVRKQMATEGLAILDAPPGTTCPMVASVRGVDAVLLVTDPTPFGLHDLKLAVEALQELSLPAAVLLNRSGLGDQRVEEYCESARLPIWGRIPDDRAIAEAYSRGANLYEETPVMREAMDKLAERVCREVIQ